MACPSFLTCTLRDIRDHEPCADGWATLLRSLNTSEMTTQVTLLQILNSNGLDDALWALRAMPDAYKFTRLLICDYTERALPIYEAQYPGDNRLRHAIGTVRRFAHGQATREELNAARATAGATAGATAWNAARAAAMAAAWAAAADAARATAGDAAGATAGAAAWNAARAAAMAAAWAAAADAARATAGATAGATAWAAAGDAFGDAAWATARATSWATAGATAGDAAGATAGAAAWNAERKWQEQHLRQRIAEAMEDAS